MNTIDIGLNLSQILPVISVSVVVNRTQIETVAACKQHRSAYSQSYYEFEISCFHLF